MYTYSVLTHKMYSTNLVRDTNLGWSGRAQRLQYGQNQHL